MAGLLTHLLEGQNLVEMQQMAQDGDPKHLGIVGRNLTLIAINERTRAEIAVAGASSAAQLAIDREIDREMAGRREEASHVREQRDRMEALERTGFKSLPKAERVKAQPDSDEAVDDFLSRLR